jgi:APA family basic amino acid/polyamine antiporter
MLNRTLTLTDLTLFGVASIIGSGGFNLIGKGVRSGGSWWPVALGISAVLVMASSFTYAEAFERFKDNTAESDMVKSIFGSYAEGAGAIAILVYNIVSIIVILVSCTKMMYPTASWSSQVTLTIFFLASMTGLSLLGIEMNAEMIRVISGALVGILVIASLFGIWGVVQHGGATTQAPTHTGFMNSLWMFFFVLVGFDNIMKFSEESKDVEDVPKAFYLANGISILLTLGVATAIAIWLPNLTYVQEKSAIGHLFAAFFGGWITEPFKWIVLLFLLLTTFVVFLATTRYLYGLGENHEWLSGLTGLNGAKAPWVAIASVFGSGSVLALLNNTGFLVKITDLGFASIASLIAGSVAVADWRDGKIGSAAISGATGASFLGLIASAFL